MTTQNTPTPNPQQPTPTTTPVATPAAAPVAATPAPQAPTPTTPPVAPAPVAAQPAPTPVATAPAPATPQPAPTPTVAAPAPQAAAQPAPQPEKPKIERPPLDPALLIPDKPGSKMNSIFAVLAVVLLLVLGVGGYFYFVENKANEAPIEATDTETGITADEATKLLDSAREAEGLSAETTETKPETPVEAPTETTPIPTVTTPTQPATTTPATTPRRRVKAPQ